MLSESLWNHSHFPPSVVQTKQISQSLKSESSRGVSWTAGSRGSASAHAFKAAEIATRSCSSPPDSQHRPTPQPPVLFCLYAGLDTREFETAPASITPAQGSCPFLLLNVAPTLQQRGHLPLTQMPVSLAPQQHRLWRVDEKREGLPQYRPTMSEQASLAWGSACACPQGFNGYSPSPSQFPVGALSHRHLRTQQQRPKKMCACVIFIKLHSQILGQLINDRITRTFEESWPFSQFHVGFIYDFTLITLIISNSSLWGHHLSDLIQAAEDSLV